MNRTSKPATNARSGPPRDVVRLRGMQFYGYHGATPQERKIGQRFEVDVEFGIDADAVRDGDLRTTLDYRRIYEVCRQCMVERQYRLIEVIARELLHDIVDECGIHDIRVTVRKPCVPLGGVTTIGAEAQVTRGAFE